MTHVRQKLGLGCAGRGQLLGAFGHLLFQAGIQFADLRLGPVTLGHVARRGEHPRHLAGLVPVNAGVVEHLGDMPVSMADGQRIVGHEAFGENPQIAGPGFLGLGEVAGKIAPDQVVAAVPGNPLGGGVHVHDLAHQTDRHQRVEAGLDQAAGIQRRGTQFRLGRLARGDVGDMAVP